MTQALEVLMLLLGLSILGVALLGVRALLQRRWDRGRTLCLIAVAGGIGCGVLPFVLASGIASSSADPAAKARLLAETVARLMNCGAAGLFALPIGGVGALVSLVGARRSRR
ncbi:hypothetical protein WME95_50215 [Sorangium sp. So ce327]|jgi:hypothetical protein|uniref:hypothetical protein n=1 Tax=Sorangium sp. So ce327 TaxID=3133301 RepID=UPI003F5E65E7